MEPPTLYILHRHPPRLIFRELRAARTWVGLSMWEIGGRNWHIHNTPKMRTFNNKINIHKTTLASLYSRKYFAILFYPFSIFFIFAPENKCEGTDLGVAHGLFSAHMERWASRGRASSARGTTYT